MNSLLTNAAAVFLPVELLSRMRDRRSIRELLLEK